MTNFRMRPTKSAVASSVPTYNGLWKNQDVDHLKKKINFQKCSFQMAFPSMVAALPSIFWKLCLKEDNMEYLCNDTKQLERDSK